MNNIFGVKTVKIGVNMFPSLGGSGHLATRLGEHLAARGHQIHFITYRRPFILMWEDHPNVYVDLVDRFDYPLFEDIGAPYTTALISKNLRVIETRDIEVIHAHYAIPHALAGYMTRQISGVPYVVTLHGSDVHTLGTDPAYRSVVKHTVERADAVTAVSQFLANKAHEKLGISREIHVIPNFVDTNIFRPHPTPKIVVEDGCVFTRQDGEKTMIHSDSLILMHASNFRAVKRVTGLVEVMKRVVEQVPDVHLVLVGDGPTRIEAERRTEELDLCDRVHFLGVHTNMQELMCAADVFLLNSTVEGMPLVLLEAMASQLPVVTTPAGGIPELVRNGIDGIVTKGFEADEYAQAVVNILQDEDLRRRLALAGRKRVVESFSVEKIVPMYERVFEEAISRRG